MKNKIFALLLSSLMLIGIGGCGGAPQTSGGGEAPPAEKTKQSEAVKTEEKGTVETLNLWHYWDMVEQQQLLADLVKEYTGSNPNVNIEISYIPYTEYIQKMLVTAAGGDLPELFIYDGNSTATYVEAGILADITDQVEASGIMENSFEGVIAEHQIAGRLYGFPVYANCLALFYNKDVVSTPPATMEELYETAKAATNGDMYGFAMSGIAGEESTWQFMPFAWGSGADFDDIAAPGAVEALDMLSRMIAEGVMSKDVVNYTQQDVRIAFETERAAMMINGPWNVGPLKENAPDMNWGVALIPKAADGQNASILGGESFGIGKNADIEKIWGFVEFMMEPARYTEFLKGLGQLPADKLMAQDPYYQSDEVSQMFIKQLECARPRPPYAKYNEMSKAIQTAIGSAFSGSQPAKEALEEAAQTVTPLYAEYLEMNQ